MKYTAPTPAHANLAFSTLDGIEKRSRAILEKKQVPGFFDKASDSQEVVKLVEDIRNAIMDYQVSGKRTERTRINANGIGLSTTVNIQSDKEIGGKAVRRCFESWD